MNSEKKIKSSYKLESNIDPMEKKPNIFGVRHIQCIYMCFGMIFGYFLRVNISAAVVYMLKPTVDGVPYYDWDPATKNLLLSGFFWGYVVAQVPSGLLAKRYGGKITLAVSTLICGIVTLLHPIAARLGDWQLFLACRILVGLTQGTVYPCVHTLLAKWTPKPERSILGSFVYSGAQIGTVIILGTSGAFSETSVGWPTIFFFSGACAVVWSLLYLFFGLDGPEDSKSISIAEREYILHHTGSGNNNVQKNLPVPWGALFTSLPFYALILAHCGFTWGFYFLLTEIPSYLAGALGLEVNKNALLSALPYFVMWVLCFVMSPISDYLINSGKLSVANSRKLFNSLGQWVPMICLIVCGYMSADQNVGAIICLTIGVGFNSASFSGYMINHMDLSPNFAGTMMGITNGFSNLLSIFAPLLVSVVVVDERRQDQWRIVFFITAGVYLVCNTCFVIFGRATVQSWNEPKTTISVANLTENENKDEKEMVK